MDKREHDKLSSASDALPDDEEYELEAPDPAVLSAEDRHARQMAESARNSIDLDDIYREAERQRGGEILEEWIRSFRFQVKHVALATAAMAIGLSLWKFGLLRHTVLILIMISVAALYGYLRWQERKHEEETARKRDELYARRRERFARPDIGKSRSEPDRSLEIVSPPASSPPDEEDETRELERREPFRLQVSQRSVIIAMVTAAVVLGIIRMFGAAATAAILGFVAMIGLIVALVGADLPQLVILGWWFILVLYVLLGLSGGM